jgi:hypothetical protein
MAGAGCGSPASPTFPTRVSAPAPTVAEGTSVAVLEIVSFQVGDHDRSGQWYFYYPELTLRETSGLSAARLTSITFREPPGFSGGTTYQGFGCLTDPVVPAGQTWDTSRVYPYCRDVDSSVPITSLEVTVVFTDSQGRPGMVTGRTGQ